MRQNQKGSHGEKSGTITVPYRPYHLRHRKFVDAESGLVVNSSSNMARANPRFTFDKPKSTTVEKPFEEGRRRTLRPERITGLTRYFRALTTDAVSVVRGRSYWFHARRLSSYCL